MQLLVQTGLRLSECRGLTFGDTTIGERSGTVLVRAGKGNKVSVKTVAAAWPGKTSALFSQSLWLTQRGTLTTSGMGQMLADLVKATQFPLTFCQAPVLTPFLGRPHLPRSFETRNQRGQSR